MSYFKRFVALTLVFLAAGVFADAKNLLVSFSSVGPDKYADGTTVLDGEWYALVWSSDGKFGGFTSDGKAARSGDIVALAAPLAENGRCPFTVFQVDSKSENYKTTGYYAVYLFDTRSADRQRVAAANEDGLPTSINGTAVSESYTAAAASANSSASDAVTASGWDASSVEGEQPKITAFKVNGAKVTIEVEGLLPSVKYNVKMGPKVDELTTYGLQTPAENATKATFKDIDAGDAKFFQVVREPLNKEAK